jgi:hypothetical protein
MVGLMTLACIDPVCAELKLRREEAIASSNAVYESGS